jgi:hypothetical protein
MPRKATKAVVPTQIQMQQAKVAEKAAKKARRKQAEEGSEELRIKLTELIRKQLPQIEKDLAEMTAKERCDTIAKLAPYVLPKLIQKPMGEETDDVETNELAELANRTSGMVN